jgi:hypothetical protein
MILGGEETAREEGLIAPTREKRMLRNVQGDLENDDDILVSLLEVPVDSAGFTSAQAA